MDTAEARRGRQGDRERSTILRYNKAPGDRQYSLRHDLTREEADAIERILPHLIGPQILTSRKEGQHVRLATRAVSLLFSIGTPTETSQGTEVAGLKARIAELERVSEPVQEPEREPVQERVKPVASKVKQTKREMFSCTQCAGGTYNRNALCDDCEGQHICCRQYVECNQDKDHQCLCPSCGLVIVDHTDEVRNQEVGLGLH